MDRQDKEMKARLAELNKELAAADLRNGTRRARQIEQRMAAVSEFYQ